MARVLREPARELPVIAEADVVVAGGGPAGFAAAVAAAREGARTVLVERYGFLGGLATAGMVAPILGHTAHDSDTPIVQGILQEMTDRMHALGGATGWEEALKQWGINFDVEAFKYVADEMISQEDVELLLHTLAVDAVAADGHLEGVVVESKSGRQAVVGKVVIDATGDADLAARAGLPFTQGRAFDGAVQSMGSFFYLAGVPDLGEAQRRKAIELVRRKLETGELSFYHPGFLAVNTVHDDYYSPNVTRIPADPTDVGDLTRGELMARREVWKLLETLRAEAEGFEDAYILATAPQVGARESRQVTGLYTLTGDDVTSGRKFEDAVARGSWWIDIHCPLGHTYPVHLCIRECPRGERCAFWKAENRRMYPDRESLCPPQGDWYDIPYRCLVPKGSANLLVAGRSISATHEAMAGARVMGTCMAIGEAAGVAAALAAAEDGVVAHVDVQTLRSRLSGNGALV
ncbi:MAG: FAD-dependent oxidoreductase [Anaerolineae bacterium]|nr:FAD-dependent oxidoreductase [Anaerolineae bacterium]